VSEPQSLLGDVSAVACEAGERIMRVYRSEFAVEHKEDDSPLTRADMAAHHHIMEALGTLAPQWPRLSEEGGTIPFEQRRRWQRYWLIDPLDGTREFVKRNGEFTVNIALIEDGRPTLGVIHAPALDITYAAAAGGGAWKQVGSAASRAIRTRRVPQSGPTRMLVSRSHGGQAQADLLAHLDHYVAMSIGSSLKFCLIAEGQADAYPRLGPTSEWDTAAGHCILAQAGGCVVDPDFRALRYNAKATLLNPHFLAFGDPDADWQGLLGSRLQQ